MNKSIEQMKAVVPEWVNYLAQDENGQWNAYEYEPQQAAESNDWHRNVGRYCRVPNEQEFNSEWQSSLHII